MDGAIAAMTDNHISDAINVRWSDLRPGQVWWHRNCSCRYTYLGDTAEFAPPRSGRGEGRFYSHYDSDPADRVWTNKSATDIMTFPPYPPIDEGF